MVGLPPSIDAISEALAEGSRSTPGSPAEAAGLLAGDVITRVAGRPIASLRDFSDVLKTLTAGQAVPVVFTRGGQEQTVQVTVAER